jgi:hypothetical protein
MDKLAKYRQIIQDVLREYAAVPIANGDVQTQTLRYRQRDDLFMAKILPNLLI